MIASSWFSSGSDANGAAESVERTVSDEWKATRCYCYRRSDVSTTAMSSALSHRNCRRDEKTGSSTTSMERLVHDGMTERAEITVDVED